MYKKALLLGSALLMSSSFLSAQVQNYSINLDQTGTVNCGALPELNGLTSYTVQFWMNPNSWNEGALLLSRGDGLKVSLGASGTVCFNGGGQTIKATSNDLAASKWAQLTLVVANGNATVLVNGIKVATGTLGALPVSDDEFQMGGNYKGRLDEVRMWKNALSSEFNYFYNNTLNQWCPQWNDLVAYYKFDQEQCANIVDYKTLYDKGEFNHHGIMSGGVTREAVIDNTKLPYLINGAYTANERFYDRSIGRDQYLLANDLIILGINSFPDGHLEYKTPCNHATVENGEYLAEFEGRSGVLKLNGDGRLDCGTKTLVPEISQNGTAATGYTFETWLYLDEWTEDAYLFRKETADGNNGFSISLGKADTKEVIVKVNGKKYVSTNNMKVGEWVHFGVTTNQGATTRLTFMFAYNGKGKFAVASLSDGSLDYTPTGMDDCVAYVGEGIKGKLDETVVWNRKQTEDDFANHMNNGNPMPGLGISQTADVMMKVSSCYNFDNPDRLGYDSYSQDEWKRIMESAYEGYRGYAIRISVASHSGWQTTISNAAKRKIFAADLARLAEGYDGVELDLEWMDSDTQWAQYGLLTDEIRAALPEGKTLMVSTHAYGAYRFPKEKMGTIDGFTFQQYGPQKTFFTFSSFKNSYNSFKSYGFPNDKIYLSYSTTTSGSFNDSGTMTSSVITGVRNGFLDNYEYSEADIDMGQLNGSNYYFIGPRQVYKRAKFVTDNNAQGIFYWDMGNDVPVSHKFNMAKHSSYGLNANVDTLVTKVDVKHTSGIVAVNQAYKAQSVKFSANPVADATFISLDNGEAMKSVTVHSVAGACVLKEEVGSSVHQLSVADLTRGIYLVTVESATGAKYVGKLVKE